jgi:hypothetical protein
VPDVAVCPGHASPFEFLADTFFERYESALVHASRSGGKTITSAIVHALNCRFKDKCWTTHAGAVQQQADRCYEQFKGFAESDLLNWLLVGEPLKSETRFLNGAKIEILPGTIAKLSGPHPQKAVVDEVEMMPWDTHEHFKQMPLSTHGIPQQTWRLSINREPTGTMARLLAEAPRRNMKLYRWCLFEVIQPTPRCEGRQDCPIYDICQRRCERANGFIQKRDAFQWFRESDLATFESQRLCLKPNAGRLEFAEFDLSVHVGPYPYHEDGDDPIVGFDYGFFPDPSHCSIIQRQGGRPVVIAEVYDWRVDPEVLATRVKALPYGKRITRGFGPQDARPGFGAFRQAGIEMQLADQDVEESLLFMHSLFRHDQGPPSLLINDACGFLIDDLGAMPPYPEGKNKRRDVPGTQNTSHFDAVHSARYALYSEYGSRKGWGGGEIAVVGGGRVRKF